MISPRTGSRVRAQRCARGFVAFSLAAGLLAAPQLLPSSAFAAADPDVGSVVLSLSTGLHGVIVPGTSLTTSVTIDNGTDETMSAGIVRVELNRTPLVDSTDLAAWFDSGQSEGDFAQLGTEVSPELASSEASTISVVTPAATLGELAAGVYPLQVTFDDGIGGDTSANSVLIVKDSTATAVTIMVPITATPASGALLTADELATLTADEGALTAQLDGVVGT